MNGTVPNKDFDAMVRKILLGMPYLQWLGLKFVHIAPGEVDFAMPLRHEITFDGRAVQAGPIGSLLDFAGGAAAFTLVPEGGMLATSDFTVKLLAPAVGESFVGRGRVISASRSRLADARAMAQWEYGGGFPVDASGCIDAALQSGSSVAMMPLRPLDCMAAPLEDKKHPGK